MNLVSLKQVNSKTAKAKTSFLLFSLSFQGVLTGQTFHVQGNVSTDSTAVKYASVNFVDQNGWTKRYTAITDSLGNYQLNVVTNVDDDKPLLLQSFELGQNYPNPFSSATEIPYKMEKQAEVIIKIYNVLGQEVRTFNLVSQNIGVHSIRWDGKNNFGDRVTPGIYFYQLQVGNETLVKKMIYTGGSISSEIQKPRVFFYNGETVTKPVKKFNLGTKLFTVEIINADNTKPWIVRKETNDIIIQSDTTLNFSVQEEIVERYFLYIGFENSYIQVYDTELHTFIDSLGGFNKYVWDVEATKGGNKLYVCSREHSNYPPTVYTVDLQTKERREILNKKGEIFLSPQGNPFIVAWNSFDTLRQVGIIDTISDNIEWIDTLDMLANTMDIDQSLVFDPQATVFYSLTSQNKLFKYNYQTKEILYTYQTVGFPSYRMVIDSSGEYIYFAGGPAIDLQKDSIVGYFGYSEAGYNGSVALSPNGEFLCATDVGAPGSIEVIPTGKVALFYTLPQGTYGSVSYIDVTHIAWMLIVGKQTDRVIFAKDGKKAYVSNGLNLIYVIDTEKEIVSDVIKLKWYSPRTIMLIPK